MEPFGIINEDTAPSGETCNTTTTLYNKFLSLDDKNTKHMEDTEDQDGSELQRIDSVSDISTIASNAMEEPHMEEPHMEEPQMKESHMDEPHTDEPQSQQVAISSSETNTDDNVREQPPESQYDDRSSENEISFEPALSREEDVLIMTMTMTSVDSQVPKTSTPKNRLPSPTKKMLMNSNIINGFSSSSPSSRITPKNSPGTGKKGETMQSPKHANTSVSGIINIFNGRIATPTHPNQQIKTVGSLSNEKSSKTVKSPSKSTRTENNEVSNSQGTPKAVTKAAPASKFSKPSTKTRTLSSSPPKSSTSNTDKMECKTGNRISATAATTTPARSLTSSLPRVASLQATKSRVPNQQPASGVKIRNSVPSSPSSRSVSTTLNSRVARPTKNPVLAERRANASATSLPTSFKASVSTGNYKNSSITGLASKDKNVADIQSLITIKASDWNSSEKCMKADKYYSQRLQMAWDKGLVSIMSSLLTSEDEKMLQELSSYCKTSKVKLAITDSFQRQKTTICILPVAAMLSAATMDPTTINTVADRRSLRAMEAMLHGVPIVTPEWILSCKNEKKISIPTTSMFIRSLPSKTLPSKGESTVDYGVAFLAAAIDASRGKYKPLSNVSIYLCGFSARKQGEVSALLRDAGAREVLTKSPAAIDRLQNLQQIPSRDQKLVFLCNDTNVVISPELEHRIKDFCKQSNFSRGQLDFVNTNWLYDSITCGEAVDLKHEIDGYKPSGGKGLELHNWIQRYIDNMTVNTAANIPAIDASISNP